MTKTILITGASGVLGQAMVTEIAKAGFAVRQAVRDGHKAKPEHDWVRFDYHDPATFGPALDGAWGLVLIAPPLDGRAPAMLGPVVEKAKTSGVEHIVFVSAMGANHNEAAPLRQVEHIVMDSGLAYTILRPNFFMENFSAGSLAHSIRTQGGIFLAAADGKTSFIAVEDIAAVAAEAFRRPLAGAEIELTGGAALDHNEVAGLIGEAAGKAVTYHPLTEQQMAEGARAAGMPQPAIDYLCMLYGIVRAGYAAALTDGVEQATGRKPVTFREFASANAARWR